MDVLGKEVGCHQHPSMDHGSLLFMEEELIRSELFWLQCQQAGCSLGTHARGRTHTHIHTRMPGRLVTCLSGVLARVPNAQYVFHANARAPREAIEFGGGSVRAHTTLPWDREGTRGTRVRRNEQLADLQ